MENDMLKQVLLKYKGPLNQFWKNVSGKDGEKWFSEFNKYLRKEPTWVLTSQEQVDYLQFIDCVILPATASSFLPGQKIWKSPLPKIVAVKGSIRSIVFPLREDPQPRRVIRYFYLKAGLTIKSISNIASTSQVTFCDIYYFILGQPMATETGHLLVGAETMRNIFFINHKGKNIPVVVYPTKHGWVIDEVPEKGNYLADCIRIFLR